MTLKGGTKFHTVAGSREGVRAMLDRRDRPLVLVSRHGLGDNIFCSPCFAPLRNIFGQVFFCSSVNAYATIFHASTLVKVIYAGGVNGQYLGLSDAEGFARQFQELEIDLGVPEAWVYHFGLFEPHLPYHDERAFVKGRRNNVEFFGTGPSAIEVPQYHVAPDSSSRAYVDAVIGRWLPDRELIAVARYGHTDCDKNFGHDSQETLQLATLIDEQFPGRFKYLSMDFLPGDHAAEGRRPNIRSVYGFIPCDAGSLYHALKCACLLITVPTGAMLVGATIAHLKMLTLWKTMSPYHFLDPQFGRANPVHAIVERKELANKRFAATWSGPARAALEGRWNVRVAPVTPQAVAKEAVHILEDQ
jgi:hypothetical protein